MVDLSISAGNLILHVRGVDKLWAFKSSLAHRGDQGRPGNSTWLVARAKNTRHQHSRSTDG